MILSLPPALIILGLFLSLLFSLEWGRKLASRALARDPKLVSKRFNTIESSIFALFGLIIAFTFSGAANRFDARRTLVVEETNMIGTAYLRVDLLSPTDRSALQDLFRRYVDSRIATYKKVPDMKAVQEELETTKKIQNEIWTRAVAATRAEGISSAATILLLPALNQMIDITTTRMMATLLHPPRIIYILLLSLGMICALLAGYGMANAPRSWIHYLGFLLIIVVTFYVIADIEYPRRGLIRVDAFDQALVDLRESMKP